MFKGKQPTKMPGIRDLSKDPEYFKPGGKGGIVEPEEPFDMDIPPESPRTNGTNGHLRGMEARLTMPKLYNIAELINGLSFTETMEIANFVSGKLMERWKTAPADAKVEGYAVALSLNDWAASRLNEGEEGAENEKTALPAVRG